MFAALVVGFILADVLGGYESEPVRFGDNIKPQVSRCYKASRCLALRKVYGYRFQFAGPPSRNLF